MCGVACTKAKIGKRGYDGLQLIHIHTYTLPTHYLHTYTLEKHLYLSCSQPAWISVIGKDEQLVFWLSVPHIVERLCEISHNDAVSLSRDALDRVREAFVLTLSEQFLLAKVIYAQDFAHADQQSALEGTECQRQAFNFRLVQQTESLSAI